MPSCPEIIDVYWRNSTNLNPASINEPEETLPDFSGYVEQQVLF